ncbi:MAG: hypothetical protein EB015_03430 [Methylocystaceae bacterium]|nr:hypothetical protein [Methylocystaceae bacterium]
MVQHNRFMFCLAVFLTCGSITTAPIGQLSAQEAKLNEMPSVDLKSLPLQEFKSGRIRITDVYALKEMEIEGRLKFGIRVVQFKSVPNSQSCGTLGPRYVVFYEAQSGAEIAIDQAQFNEFVGVKNYLMKFEDNWDNLKDKKQKEIDYTFDIRKDANGTETDFDSFQLSGNKAALTLSLFKNKKMTTIFRSRDLKEIAAFSQMIDYTVGFLQTYNFSECL